MKKGMPILKTLNYIGSILGIFVVLAGGLTYVNGIDNKAQAANDSIGEIKKQRELDRDEWLNQFKVVSNAASAAQADSSATRKYTEFIVNRLGGRPSDILRASASSTNE